MRDITDLATLFDTYTIQKQPSLAVDSEMTATFEGRRQRELSVDELNALMLQSQSETYGEAPGKSALGKE